MAQPKDILNIADMVENSYEDAVLSGYDEYDFLCGIGLWLDLSVKEGTLPYSKVLQMTLFLQQQLSPQQD